jgi:hypothetical protein
MGRFDILKRGPIERVMQKLQPETTSSVGRWKTAGKILQWLVFNALYGALMFYGLYKGHKGAWNVLAFCTWALFAISVLAFLSKNRIKSPPKRTIPPWMAVSCNLLMIAGFAYFGRFVYSTVLLITWIFTESVYSKDKDKEPKKEDKP